MKGKTKNLYSLWLFNFDGDSSFISYVESSDIIETLRRKNIGYYVQNLAFIVNKIEHDNEKKQIIMPEKHHKFIYAIQEFRDKRTDDQLQILGANVKGKLS